MPLARLAAEEKAELALCATRDSDPEDHALAAFFLMQAGKHTAAAPHLAKAGEAADPVRALFE